MTAYAPLATSEFPLLQLRQAAGNIGAEIIKIKLATYLKPEIVSQIESAVNDYGTQRRAVRRVAVNGDIAIGVDGRWSNTLAHAEQANAQVA